MTASRDGVVGHVGPRPSWPRWARRGVVWETAPVAGRSPKRPRTGASNVARAQRPVIASEPVEPSLHRRPTRPSPYRPPEHAETVFASQVLGPLTAVESKHAPPMLHLAGDPSLLSPQHRRVAIVGSREASQDAIKRASRLARALADAGVVVVSGLAKGVDKAAHESAMREKDGHTVAVIGTALDRCYPAEHARLQEAIYRDHLLVSQFAAEERTFKSSFVERNRVMALLCHASVIVEAGDTSGTLSQAAETQRLGRPLFLMRSVVEMPGITWPARFLNAGAIVLDDVAQVLDTLAASA